MNATYSFSQALAYLYGAGMINGILIAVTGSKGIAAAIGDAKAGCQFHARLQ